MVNDTQKILVCGATGFIGRNLVEYLSKDKKYDVTAVGFQRKIPDSINCQKVYGDLRNPDFVNKITKGFDTVLQFAATTSGSKDIVNDPSIHVTDNAVMNSYLLKYSSENGVKKFIFPSCTVMYQSSKQLVEECHFDANEVLFPSYFGVGNTKLYIEKMCEFFSRVSDLSTIVLRHSNVYGFHDKYDLDKSHFLGATIRKIIDAKNEETITVWGDGQTGRDIIFVADMVNAVISAMELKNKHEIFNVGTGIVWTVNEIVKMLIDISGKKLTVSHDLSKPSINTSLALNANKFSKATGWKPIISTQKGLELSYDWARQNFKFY